MNVLVEKATADDSTAKVILFGNKLVPVETVEFEALLEYVWRNLQTPLVAKGGETHTPYVQMGAIFNYFMAESSGEKNALRYISRDMGMKYATEELKRRFQQGDFPKLFG